MYNGTNFRLIGHWLQISVEENVEVSLKGEGRFGVV